MDPKPQPSKMRTILVDGALRWGVLTAALFVLLNLLWSGRSSLREVVIAAVVFPLAGVGLGWWRWKQRSAPARPGSGSPGH